MSADINSIVDQIRAALAVTDPDLDTSAGTTTRKIVDAVAESISESYLDQHMLSYTFDIDSKTGSDLDVFTQAVGGITRLAAKRATGTITFVRTGVLTATVNIPVNAQINSNTTPPVPVTTVTGAVMLPNQTTVTVAAQAVASGPDGNVAANVLTALVTPIDGVATVTNMQPLTGGLSPETDSELRDRWKKTVFRSMAGTECQPPGTMILVPHSSRHAGGQHGGTKVTFDSVPIESIKVGDRVCSWRQGYVIREGREVAGIASRDYSGQMVVVQTSDGRTSRYTPNHRCMARMAPALDDRVIVYLQRRGTSFRIGTTAGGTIGSNKKTGTRGVVSRMMDQGADEAWVLSTHESKDEALLEEALTSWQFGIPMTLFAGNRSRGDQSQGRLDTFWEKVGDLTDAAIRCLGSFGRIIDFPLVQASTSRKMMWNRAGIVQACNLIDGAEVVDTEAMHATGEPFPRVQYAPVRVSREWYDGQVWSIDVDREHTYIADGFATHNSMYLGTALDDENVTAATVLGASKRRSEQIQVASGVAISSADDIAYTFSTGVFVGGDLANGVIMLKDIDYTWDTSVNPPRVVFTATTYDTGAVDGGGLPIRAASEGALLDLEFEYTPYASRNDPNGTRFGTSTMSKVDVIVAGQRPVAAQQSVVFSDFLRFTGDSTSVLFTGKFSRLDGVAPVATNVFLPLSFGPIISVPDVLAIGGVTFGRIGAPTSGITHPSAYAVVHDITPLGFTATSRFGLEFDTSVAPANGTVFTIGANSDYIYDDVPRSVQVQVDRWRLVGVDAKVHSASLIYLRISVALMYDRTASRASVNEAIDVAVSDYLGKVGLGGVVQVSDIENVIHNVPGVDNVRVLQASDYLSWTIGTTNTFNLGLQRVVDGSVVETYVTTGGRLKDIPFGDAEVPAMESIIKVPKAQNTFQA